MFLEFHKTRIVINAILFLSILGLAEDPAQAQFDFEKEPINYSKAESNDAVAKLVSRLESGEIELRWDDQQGWLPDLLEKLDISTKSQALVFSKTSLQFRYITPQNPRAIFFNDDTYLGYVPGGEIIEISSVDDQIGAVFYSIDQREAESPQITRDHSHCMTCHGTSKTKNIPGYLIRSVFTSGSGQPHYSMGSTTTDHRTEFKKRFGGWYVTGEHGEMKHRGNKIARRDPRDPFDWEKHANIDSLTELIDTGPYPESTSDLVALMVLEHQAQMHNMITRAGFETRQAIHYQEVMNRVLERGDEYESESTARRIKAAGDELLKYLLFADEYKLESPIKGSNQFARQFEEQGKRDNQGRSLRDFDLQTRLFRYPCSFLIYSTSFDELPPKMLNYVEERLIEILAADEVDPEFSHLTAEDRQAILEILVDTKPRLERRLQNQ